ncbi:MULTISPECIES: hypothetical protein [Parabacteroides]|jgi:hypothetical protein|uniref:hypothetical protein n=1 Tax=Parabacteroides TaxID=375288 RepID=UPI001CC9FDAF|nr:MULTISPECIES: hypothetical protein [Parabacteroides]MCM0716127.1 hypothetical protein [Parabacteroides sp. TA-V-105]
MNNEVRFLIDALIERLVLLVMDDFKLSLLDALSLVYNSQLYEKITDLETGLYYQSALYNYELLRKEITLGKIA